jgi:hypothetical protein
MLLFNLLILFLVVILSYVFKSAEIKKYDTQLVFILLVFGILLTYKTLSYFHDKRMNANAVRAIAERFSNTDNLNDFIADTLSDKEKIIALEQKVKQYEDVYDTTQILNNDLDNKIKYAENALSKLSDQYIVDLEKGKPSGDGVQISLDVSEEGVESTETPDILTNKISTDSVKNVILSFLESIKKEYANEPISV